MMWRSRKDREAIDAELRARQAPPVDLYELDRLRQVAEGQTALADSATETLRQILRVAAPRDEAFKLAACWLDAHNRLPGDNP